jgi:hypothetical protein
VKRKWLFITHDEPSERTGKSKRFEMLLAEAIASGADVIIVKSKPGEYTGVEHPLIIDDWIETPKIEVHDFKIEAPEPIEPVVYGPQRSKGDKHRNKRYRWAHG